MIGTGSKCSFYSSGPNTLVKLQQFIDRYKGHHILGYLSYDLKDDILGINDMQNRKTTHKAPDCFFFVPEVTLTFYTTHVEIQGYDENIINSILKQKADKKLKSSVFQGEVKPRWSRSEYRSAFQKLQFHISQGDVYEANLCQEFYAQPAKLSPFAAFLRLNQFAPNPFSCYFRHEDLYIISASPERFLARRKEKLISQPIKGTAERGSYAEQDEQNKIHLKSNPKDLAENIMIVDLVRNDLTKNAKKGTVKVEEALGLYTFSHVHQLISTISCKQDDNIKFSEIIKNTFPPGSMTGAPKIKAMEICEQLEEGKRGLYSGSIGYISPNGDFDFNVIIRSLIYNKEEQYISYHVGGAITALSSEEEEYQECLIKSKAISELLSNTEISVP